MSSNSEGRTLTIGSLYGGIKALKKCLLLSKYDAGKDRLIFLGDYIGDLDYAPHTIEWLTWLKETAVKEHIFIKGEGERWLSKFLSTGHTNPYWASQLNGNEVVAQYIDSKLITSSRHRKFLGGMNPYYLDKENNKLYVNAGFPDEGVGNHTFISSYYVDKSFWANALSKSRRYEITKRGAPRELKFYRHKEIYITKPPTLDNIYTSRTPETKLYNGEIGQCINKPMKRHTVHNINTGVNLGGGFLTVMDTETKEFWQAKNI